MTIIDGKALSEKTLEKIKEVHGELQEKVGRKAGLAVIIVGENPASKIYVRNKNTNEREFRGIVKIVNIKGDRIYLKRDKYFL